MNKILTLYNIEFKRIYKLYFALLGVILTLNIGTLAIKLYEVMNSVAGRLNTKPSIGLLKTQEAKMWLLDYKIAEAYRFTIMLLGFSVVLCLFYAIIIWYRDIVGKSKTAYTLFMLPNNKFAIYIAKAIMVVVMIYGVMATQMLAWIILVSVTKILSGIDIYEMKEILVHGVRTGADFHLIQPFLLDFVMINLIGVILAVIVIFTGIMIQKAYNKKGVVIGILYIVGIIMTYIGTTSKAGFSDEFLIGHIIFYIITFALSIGLSYYLLNKKIYM